MSGRFDGEKKTSSKYRIGVCLLLMFFAVITVFSLLGDGNKSGAMCAELSTLMFDDPELLRLHNDYPVTMIELHQFFDKNCDNIDDQTMIEINNPDRITINVGEP